MSEASSSASPTTISPSAVPSFAVKSSKTSRWTYRREPAVQDWPWRANRIAAITCCTVASSLESGKTIAGALPPSSSDTGQDALGRRPHRDPAHLGRARERDLRDPRVLHQRAAALLAVAGEDVQHAVGQVLGGDLGHPQHAQRRVLGRLEHERVAGAQRHRDLQRGQHHGSVPGDDRGDDPERLAARVAEHVLAQRQRLALLLARDAAVVAEDVGRHRGLATGLGPDRVAGLGRDRLRELLADRGQILGDLQQRDAAVPRRLPAPLRKRLGRGLHRTVHVLGRPARDGAERLAPGRVLDLDPVSTGRVDPLAADQHLVGQFQCDGHVLTSAIGARRSSAARSYSSAMLV